MFKKKYRKDNHRKRDKREEFISQEEYLENEERRIKSKFLMAGIIFFAIILLAALVFIGAWFLCEVKQIKVEGNELYDDELIAAQVLNDEYSWNAMYVFLKYKFKDTEAIPFIDTMKISLENRNTVVINVYEKELVGYTYVASTGQYAYIDKEGIVVERSTNKIEGVAFIDGLDVTEVNLYEKLKVEDDTFFKELLSITNSLEKYGLMPEKVLVREMGKFELSYGDVTVNFGKAEHINDKVIRINEIMPKLEGLTGILHMENWKNADSESPFEQTKLEGKN